MVRRKKRKDDKGQDKDDEEEDELIEWKREDFTWFNDNDKAAQKTCELDTYIAFYNNCGRTIQPDDQVFFDYGQRNNQYLFMTYGFTILDNKYDSYEFYVNRCLADVKDFNKFEYFEDTEEVVSVKNKFVITHTDLQKQKTTFQTEKINLKKGKLNTDLLSYIKLQTQHQNNQILNPNSVELNQGNFLKLKDSVKFKYSISTVQDLNFEIECL